MLKRKPQKAPKHNGLPFAVTRKRTPERTALISQCDALLSKIVRLEDKCCLYCKRVWDFNKLYNHHFFSRKHLGTRFDRKNCGALCFHCHDGVAHTDPEIFREWLVDRMGIKAFEMLKFKAMSRTKFDVSDLRMIKLDLQMKLKELRG